MDTQTVRETLEFYAELKLPPSYTAQQRRERVFHLFDDFYISTIIIVTYFPRVFHRTKFVNFDFKFKIFNFLNLIL